MKKTGTADLKLLGGQIPPWLFNRMVEMSRPIVEAIVLEYGHKHFLEKLSDPFWFQSFGAVIGMDWNSSGATTAVMSALKKSIGPISSSIGIYFCGGKGKDSLKTPQELMAISEKKGWDGTSLCYSSKLAAKVDNTAVQDGFQLYQHYFVVDENCNWSVIQQGMHPKSGQARRYHWHSGQLISFVEDPHTAVCGTPQGAILNLVHKDARPTQAAILKVVQENPDTILNEVKKLKMPMRSGLQAKDVDLKRLGAILWLSQEMQTSNFESLLLLKGMGPRALQSLTLVSEVIHGTPSRFSDPARFSLAHGGKSGKPFPILTHVYDNSIQTLSNSVQKAKIGESEKATAIKKLSELARLAEKDFSPNQNFQEWLENEKRNSWKYGGKTIKGEEKPPTGMQLNLFDEI